MPARRAAAPLAGAAVAAALLLVAFNLRGPFVAISPVLPEVRADTGLGAPAAGLLTTLPVLCFTIFSPVVPALARRWGMDRVLAVALALLAAGVLVRLAAPVACLFAGTLLIGATIAVGNVLLPALIKRDFPAGIGVMTGLYVTSMGVGATVAAAGTVLVGDLTGWGWRPTIGLWALPALAALAAWLPQLRRRPPAAVMGPEVAVPSLWSDRLAWQVVVFMGLQSLIYYSVTAWLPTLFVDRGLSAEAAGVQLGFFNVIGLPASLLAPILATRAADQTRLIAAACAVTVAGMAGVVAAPTAAPLVWMALLGVGQGATVGLALTLVGLRSPDSLHASQLSGMVQSASFVIAASGPLAMGALHELAGSWPAAFALPLAALVPMTLAGLAAGRDRYVGRQALTSGSVA